MPALKVPMFLIWNQKHQNVNKSALATAIAAGVRQRSLGKARRASYPVNVYVSPFIDTGFENS